MKNNKEEHEILDALEKNNLELVVPTAKELKAIKFAADNTINRKPGSKNA